MSNVLIPYYSGNIRLTKVLGHVTIDQFIHAHKNPKPETIALIQRISEADEKGWLKLKRELKHHLFAFTPRRRCFI